MKHNKIFSIIAFSIILAVLVLPLISAQRYEDNYFRYGTIKPDGTLTTTNTPITNVNVLGFVCSSDNCATVSGRLWSNVLTSTNDFMRLIYPTTLQSQYGYGIYVYKEGYIPYEISADWWGTNPNDPVGPYNDYLTRKEVCASKLMSMSFDYTNNIINVQTQARSPVSSAGPLDYLPTELISIYSANAQVNLEIKKDSQTFYTETKSLTMLPSELKDLSFSVPNVTQPGTYTIRVYTTVNNEQKCLSYNEDSKQEILVIPEPPQIICNANSDCGTDGCLGDPNYCIGNQVFQNFIYYTCHAPGTEQSYCSNQILPFLMETCHANYYSDDYCYNNNVYHDLHGFSCSTGSCHEQTTQELVETCANGCANNACLSVCSQNSDCGTDGYIGDRFCKQDGNVYQNYRTFTCNNPNTAQSTCLSATEERKLETCQYGCANGQCNQPECTDDDECPQGEFCINDICVPPVCSQNSDCGQDGCDGEPNYCVEKQIFQDFRIFTCNNPGQKNSYCSNQLFPFLMETCPANYYSDAYCENNNLYKDFHDFGCATGSCFEQINKELFQTCTNGCNTTTNTCNPGQEDTTAPVITLISPGNNTSAYKGQVNFLFNVADESIVPRCDLKIEYNNTELLMHSITNVSKTQANTLSHNFETAGNYKWRITCTDEFTNEGTSEKRTLTIIESPQPICQTNNDCGNASSELICRNNDVTRKTTAPKCVFDILSLSYKCENEITYTLDEECDHSCEIRNSVARCKPSSQPSSYEECYDENGNVIDCDLIDSQTQTRRTTTNYEPTIAVTSSTQSTETNQSTTQYLGNLIQSSKYNININYVIYAITGLIALLAIIIIIALLTRKPRRPVRKQSINPVKK